MESLPLAVVSTGGAYWFPAWSNENLTPLFFQVRNNAGNTIIIRKILAGNNSKGNYFDCGGSYDLGPGECSSIAPLMNMSITIPPGEEACFGNWVLPGYGCKERTYWLVPVDFPRVYPDVLPALRTECNHDGTGSITIENFGFEYDELIEGHTVTKKQISSKPFSVRCAGQCAIVLSPNWHVECG